MSGKVLVVVVLVVRTHIAMYRLRVCPLSLVKRLQSLLGLLYSLLATQSKEIFAPHSESSIVDSLFDERTNERKNERMGAISSFPFRPVNLERHCVPLKSV